LGIIENPARMDFEPELIVSFTFLPWSKIFYPIYLISVLEWRMRSNPHFYHAANSF
jgi:hypothetical protein